MVSGFGARRGVSSPGLLVVALSAAAMTAAVLQNVVVPVLNVMERQLNASTIDVSWTVTAALLAGVATTPLIGRLADLHTKKRVLLIVLTVVFAGSLLAVLTTSLPVLIVARAMQGTSFAAYPIAISILRDELRPERLMGATTVISGVLGFGAGLTLVIVGLLMRGGDSDYHRVFWFTVAFMAVVIIAVLVVVPSRPQSGIGSVDVVGAVGLAGGLSLLLLAGTRGNLWGWTSPRVLACAIVAVAALVTWWWWEQRRTEPLISTRMLARRPVLLANIATLSVGMALYAGLLGLTGFVQAPKSAGYGFGASVLEASVIYLLPGALAGFLTALFSGRYIDRYGARPVLIMGAIIGLGGFGFLTAAHDSAWQVVVGGILINAYISLAYGALPVLVVREVEAGETGAATSMNAIARSIGSSIAAAVAGVLLSRKGNPGGGPPESSFTAIFAMGAVAVIIALLTIVASRAPLRDIESVDELADARAMNHEWG